MKRRLLALFFAVCAWLTLAGPTLAFLKWR